jgi:hypothetical protein
MTRLSKTQERIYLTLKNSSGMTVGECWSKAFQGIFEKKSLLSPRFNEMLRMGIVQQNGKRRCRVSRNLAIIWTVTDQVPVKISYHDRTTEYHVVEANKIILRVKQLRDVAQEYRGNKKYEIWRATSA